MGERALVPVAFRYVATMQDELGPAHRAANILGVGPALQVQHLLQGAPTNVPSAKRLSIAEMRIRPYEEGQIGSLAHGFSL